VTGDDDDDTTPPVTGDDDDDYNTPPTTGDDDDDDIDLPVFVDDGDDDDDGGFTPIDDNPDRPAIPSADDRDVTPEPVTGVSVLLAMGALVARRRRRDNA